MSVVVHRLTDDWLCNAAEVGIQRQRSALEKKREMFGRKSDNPLFDHINGAIAECTVAAFLRVRWEHAIGRIDVPDVDGWIDVRSRRFPGLGTDMIIYTKDPDERPFVHTHVVQEDLSVRIIGWLYAHEAKAQATPHRPGVFYVPPPYRDIAELEALVEARRAVA